MTKILASLFTLLATAAFAGVTVTHPGGQTDTFAGTLNVTGALQLGGVSIEVATQTLTHKTLADEFNEPGVLVLNGTGGTGAAIVVAPDDGFVSFNLSTNFNAETNFATDTYFSGVANFSGGLIGDGSNLGLNGNTSYYFSHLTSIPSTLSGYGITDAYPLSGNPSGFLAATLDTDGTLAANSDANVPSQAAVVTYVANHAGGLPSWFDGSGTGYNPTAAFSLDATNGYDYSVCIGASSQAGNYGTAVGDTANAQSESTALGAGTIASNSGVAVGIGCDTAGGVNIGYFVYGDNGVGIGYACNDDNYGVCVGNNSYAQNGGVAIGNAASANGAGNVAVGGDSDYTNTAYIPDGYTDTVELGRGTAALNGGLNFRGTGIFDWNGGSPRLATLDASQLDFSLVPTVSDGIPGHLTQDAVTHILSVNQ